MSLQNHLQSFIQNALGVTVSRRLFSRWTQLYHETQRIVRDPEECAARGRGALLSAKEREFMVELVRNKPILFLDKIRERLYNHSGTLLGMAPIHENLVQRLHITLKNWIL